MGLVLGTVYFLLAAVVGAGLTSLLDVRFHLVERFAFGLFIGIIPGGLAARLFAIAFGFGWEAFWLPMLVLVGLAAALAGRRRAMLALEWKELLETPRAAYLWLGATLLPWAIYFTIFFSHAYVFEHDGLYTGFVYIWGDWALHLSYASSFVYGQNLPPQFPVMAHQHSSYHFMADFLAAGLVANGLSLTQALAFGSCVILIALVAVFHLAAARLSGSALAGFLAANLFLLSGGIGFVYLLADFSGVLARGGDWGAFLLHLPRSYTQIPQLNYQWLDPILGYLVPQRAVAFGLAVVAILLVLVREAMVTRAWRVMAFAGTLVGLTPLWNANAPVALAAVMLFAAAIDLPSARSDLVSYLRFWGSFGLPVLVLAVPTVLWMQPLNGGGLAILRLQPGWMAASAGHDDNGIWFWFKNLGIFVPLAIVAQLAARRLWPPVARTVAPFWLLFLLPNFVVVEPWDFDNTKLFLIWFLAAVIIVAGLLAVMIARGLALRSLALAAVVLLCLAGAADVWRALGYRDNSNLFLTNDDLKAGYWVRDNTAPNALFLTASNHNHPVPTIGGRRIFLGYTGWLFALNLPYQPAEVEAHRIYAGGPDADALLRREGIAYVVVGPQELAATGMAAHEQFFRSRYPVVYSSRGYRIYRIS